MRSINVRYLLTSVTDGRTDRQNAVRHVMKTNVLFLVV